jgi:hydrogenase maturation protease
MVTDRCATIVACGRRDSGDDSLGIQVGEMLARRALPQTRLVLTESPGIDLIAEMAGVELFILIDAARATPAHPPGSWERIDYRDFPGSLPTHPSHSSHGLSIAEALALAEKLGELPPHVVIYAVFGQRFELETEPSPQAVSVLADVAHAIEREVSAWSASGAVCTS